MRSEVVDSDDGIVDGNVAVKSVGCDFHDCLRLWTAQSYGQHLVHVQQSTERHHFVHHQCVDRTHVRDPHGIDEMQCVCDRSTQLKCFWMCAFSSYVCGMSDVVTTAAT